jgi:hypothetical protein
VSKTRNQLHVKKLTFARAEPTIAVISNPHFWSFTSAGPRWRPPTQRGRPSQALKNLMEQWYGDHGELWSYHRGERGPKVRFSQVTTYLPQCSAAVVEVDASRALQTSLPPTTASLHGWLHAPQRPAQAWSEASACLGEGPARDPAGVLSLMMPSPRRLPLIMKPCHSFGERDYRVPEPTSGRAPSAAAP